jgi:hypothetical protein
MQTVKNGEITVAGTQVERQGQLLDLGDARLRAAIIILLPAVAAAGCPDERTIDAMTEAFFKKMPGPIPPATRPCR